MGLPAALSCWSASSWLPIQGAAGRGRVFLDPKLLWPDVLPENRGCLSSSDLCFRPLRPALLCWSLPHGLNMTLRTSFHPLARSCVAPF